MIAAGKLGRAAVLQYLPGNASVASTETYKECSGEGRECMSDSAAACRLQASKRTAARRVRSLRSADDVDKAIVSI